MDFEEDKLTEIMREVMQEVSMAILEGNSPFAAFLVDSDFKIVYKAHNTVNTSNDPTAHAEINLIREACSELKTRNLSEYFLISNAWSCSMCMSAAIKAKISNFIFGAPSEDDMNPKITIFDIKKKCKGKINIVIGILEEECRKQIEKARQSKTSSKND